ncbi:MAG: hypothetical protein GKR90_21920 [Pseudomonadales bacterium]|nr:hypothetical protein [Pseudomonadales bacterium]
MRALANVTGIFSLTLFMTACVSYEASRNSASGSFADRAILDRIVPGETTSSWLIQQTGEPDTIQQTSLDVEVWQYSSVTQSTTRVRALPLVAVQLSDQTRTVFHFEIKDEVVTQFWREQL